MSDAETISGLLKRIQALEKRLGRTEVQERLITSMGSWTPTLVGATTAGVFTYDTTNTAGRYLRIGDRVLIEGRVRITAIGTAPAGVLSIGGLPVISASTPTLTGAIAFGAWTGITLASGATFLGGRVFASSQQIGIAQSGSGIGAASVQGAALALVGGAADFMFAGHYQLAS